MAATARAHDIKDTDCNAYKGSSKYCRLQDVGTLLSKGLHNPLLASVPLILTTTVNSYKLWCPRRVDLWEIRGPLAIGGNVRHIPLWLRTATKRSFRVQRSRYCKSNPWVESIDCRTGDWTAVHDQTTATLITMIEDPFFTHHRWKTVIKYLYLLNGTWVFYF